jgi:23S rRNA pseudouridine1911/1915/1917 synthase
MNESVFTVNESGTRLDVYLASQLPEYTRSRLQNMIKDGDVTVNGLTVKSGYKLSAGDQIRMQLREAVSMTATAEEIEREMLY